MPEILLWEEILRKTVYKLDFPLKLEPGSACLRNGPECVTVEKAGMEGDCFSRGRCSPPWFTIGAVGDFCEVR